MRQNHYTRMKKIILTCMIIVPIIPFISVLYVGYYYFTLSIETSANATFKRIVGDHRHMIDSFLSERKSDLEFILRSQSYAYLSQLDNLRKIFNDLQHKSNAFVDLGVFNESGTHVAYEGPYALQYKDYSEADWFKRVISQGYYISDIFLGYRQIPHFIIAVAHNEPGNVWVVRSTIDTMKFNQLVESVKIGSTGEAYILNSESVLQTDRRSGGNLMDKLEEETHFPVKQNEILSYIKESKNRKKYLYATTWLQDKQWLLVIRQDKADAFSTLNSAVKLVIIISLTGALVITLAAFLLTGQIIKRMQRMDEEKEQLGQQLIRAHRLAELGEMAAGFAHEINNPLQIIKSEHSLIEMNLDELKTAWGLQSSESLKELEDSLDQISLQINRCSQITQAILKFGRQSEPRFQDMQLNDFIPEMISMIEKKASVNGIEIKKELSAETRPIYGDPGQLQQVLLNLLNNAIDAIAEKHEGKGELTIKVGNASNGMVEIAVKDTGPGIDPENLKKIFSPFFTTKPVGKGTGLGLSVCYGIINHMGGEMEVESKIDSGSTFIIRVPVAQHEELDSVD